MIVSRPPFGHAILCIDEFLDDVMLSVYWMNVSNCVIRMFLLLFWMARTQGRPYISEE
jgi:hypothetical protein